MRVAAPLGIAGVFITVLLRVDTAMLALYKSDAVVGNYGAAYRLFEATLVVGWSVTAAVYPVFSRLTRDSEPPLGLVFERSLKLVLAPTLPLAIGAVVLGDPLVRLVYGHGFDRGRRRWPGSLRRSCSTRSPRSPRRSSSRGTARWRSRSSTGSSRSRTSSPTSS